MTAEVEEVKEFLDSVGLKEYQNKLISNGFDYIDGIKGITLEDLKEIGILEITAEKIITKIKSALLTTTTTTTSSITTFPTTTTTFPTTTIEHVETQQMLSRLSGTTPLTITILVFGMTGVGKSSTLNTIFGSKLFEQGSGIDPVTKAIHCKEIKIGNTTLILYDSPGIAGNNKNNSDKKTLCSFEKIVNKSEVDLILLVESCSNRILGPCRDALTEIQKCKNAPRLLTKTIVVMTHAMDSLPDEEYDVTKNYDENWSIIRNNRKKIVSQKFSEMVKVLKIPVYLLENNKIVIEKLPNIRGEKCLPDGTPFMSEIFEGILKCIGEQKFARIISISAKQPLSDRILQAILAPFKTDSVIGKESKVDVSLVYHKLFEQRIAKEIKEQFKQYGIIATDSLQNSSVVLVFLSYDALQSFLDEKAKIKDVSYEENLLKVLTLKKKGDVKIYAIHIDEFVKSPFSSDTEWNRNLQEILSMESFEIADGNLQNLVGEIVKNFK
jgi:predicted GTPase